MSYRISIQEKNISTTQLFQGSGRIAYAIESERGKYGEFLFIESEDDLKNTIGEPTSLRLSQQFNVIKNILQYGNDVVLQRALNIATAQMERIGIDYNSSGLEIPLTDGSDVAFIEDFELHTIAKNIVQHPSLQMEFYAKESYDTNRLSVAISKPDYTQSGVNVWADVNDTADGVNKFSDNIIDSHPRPENEEIAICVLVDGIPTEWHIVSLKDGNKSVNNENNYITDYLSKKSNLIEGFTIDSVFADVVSFEKINLANGTKGVQPTPGDVETAYSKFVPKDDIAFDYIIDGMNKSNKGYIKDSIAEVRKDCIAIIGPDYSSIVGITDNDTIVQNVIDDRLSEANSSWAVYVDNWKQVYDKYLDKNIWIPCVSDFVGNKVRLNFEKEVWTPAAGTVNGLFKNVIKLGYQPTEPQQKRLIKNRIMPVFSKKGKGVLCDEQMTMIDQNVGVQNLNGREVLRISEQFVSDISVDFLHQFNTATVRQRWYNIVSPFFEDLLKRDAITRYEIRYDEVLNAPDVIDSGEFRVVIILTTNRPIRKIKIVFYEVGNAVNFDEIPV